VIDLPPGFVVVEGIVDTDGDVHAAGRRAAAQAIAAVHPDATLAYDGTRPIVLVPDGGPIAVSITHTRTCVLAIAAPVKRLGIDLVDDDDADRIERLAPRYPGAATPAQLAATEARLKACGLGLLDGGLFDRSPPPTSDELTVVLDRFGDRTLAIAFDPDTAQTVSGR
jgi:hypothetical protein